MGCSTIFQCQNLDYTAPVYNKHEGKFLAFHQYQCTKKLSVTFADDFDHDVEVVKESGEYHECKQFLQILWNFRQNSPDFPNFNYFQLLHSCLERGSTWSGIYSPGKPLFTSPHPVSHLFL